MSRCSILWPCTCAMASPAFRTNLRSLVVETALDSDERVEARTPDQLHGEVEMEPLLLHGGGHAYDPRMGELRQSEGPAKEALADAAIVRCSISTFSATVRPMTLSTASQTYPKPPRPISLTRW